MADDLVEERLAQIDFALPETRLIGALWVTLELAAVGYRRTHICFAVLILVDQLDMSSKEPLHLVAEAGLRSAAAAVNTGSERLRNSSRLPVRTASVETQASNSRGKLPKGSLCLPVAVMMSV